MRSAFARFIAAGALLSSLATINSQSGSLSPAPSPQDSGTTYQSKSVVRATTRLVVLDVVATDDKGQPVADLTRDDFTVLEDGKPQKVSEFAFHHRQAAQAARQLPPNVVSNAAQYAGNSAVNVILLDAANTDFSSRAYAQEMLIKYLETGPSIQPTAVYALERKLRLLHDFTTDTKALRDALAHYRPQVAEHLETTEAMASPFGHRGSFQANTNNPYLTMYAMHFLARSLGGYPGRKNLLWISEGFPFALFPDLAQGGGSIPMNTNAWAYEEITNELMNAQVAVYPIDAAGVTKNDRFDPQTAMAAMAERTGGKTYFRRNDIDMGVRTSLDDGATYYTLEYYPQNKTWDGKFRNIEVKVNRAGAKLEYRRGYYAQEPNRNQNWINYDFSQALNPNAPSATGVLFQAGIIPSSDKTQPQVVVNFAVDPHTIAFESAADGLQHASLTCVVWAYAEKGDPKSGPVRSEGNSNAALNPEQFQQVMQGYFPCRRSLDLKPGRYTLRMGVLDRTTNLIGATSAPLTVP